MNPEIALVLERLSAMQEDVSELKQGQREMKSELREVKEEVRATNGRLRKVELWRHGLEAVQTAHAWIKPAAISFVSGAGLALFGFLLYRL